MAGLRYLQFHSATRSSPSRASPLARLHPHQSGIGILTYDSGSEGYTDDLNRRGVAMAEALRGAGAASICRASGM